MDLSTLLQAKKNTHTNDKKRLQQSQALYDKGRQLIREIVQTEAIDKVSLQQAIDYFTQGIHLYRQNPDNFAGLGYLFFITDKPIQAIEFLRSALELKADHVMAKELMKFVQINAGQIPQTIEAEAPPVIEKEFQKPVLPQDYDNLYDSVEMQIVQCFKQMMSDEVRTYKPTISPTKFQVLRGKHKGYIQMLRQIHKQIDIIDEEIDTTDLRKQLQPVEKALKQMKLLIQVFQQFLDIRAEIRKYEKLVKQVTKESESTRDPEDMPVLEENLELLLDQCDAIADQLDALDEKGYRIDPLEPPYEGYIHDLELFQESLEDTKQRLQDILAGGA